MNAGELKLGALGALLQAAVPALESFAGGPDGVLGSDELAQVLASWAQPAPRIARNSSSWPPCSS
jgi:hypothetical protein